MYRTGLLILPPQHPQLSPREGNICLDRKGMIGWYDDRQPYLTKTLLPFIINFISACSWEEVSPLLTTARAWLIRSDHRWRVFLEALSLEMRHPVMGLR